MMEFEDLIEAKDAAVAEHETAEKIKKEAEYSLEMATNHFNGATERLAVAHQAIHDVLVEKGEHYGIDQATGTVTVYKPIEDPPGWCAVHPIPGRTKAAK